MHVLGWLPPGVCDRDVSRLAAAHQVDAIPLSFFAAEPVARGGLVLGYANVSPPEIVSGVRRLGRAIVESIDHSRLKAIG
jgi:DNA-binding transcriptional MocR family regulator